MFVAVGERARMEGQQYDVARRGRDLIAGITTVPPLVAGPGNSTNKVRDHPDVGIIPADSMAFCLIGVRW